MARDLCKRRRTCPCTSREGPTARGIIAVHGQEERPLWPGGFKVLGGPGKHLWGEPVLLRPSVGRVCEVLLEVLRSSRSEDAWSYQGMPDLLWRGDPQRPVVVRTLSPDVVV